LSGFLHFPNGSPGNTILIVFFSSWSLTDLENVDSAPKNVENVVLLQQNWRRTENVKSSLYEDEDICNITLRIGCRTTLGLKLFVVETY
jgi:hypothetical protein